MHAVMAMLLDYGADPNYTEVKHLPLDFALSGGDLTGVLMLVKAGSHTDDRETRLWTLANEGQTAEHQELARLVAERGIKPVASELPALFHTAVKNGDTARVRLLIAAGVDVNSSSETPPLLNAAYNGYPEIVRALLDSGADPLVVDKHDSTPIMLTVLHGCTQRRLNALAVMRETMSSDEAGANDLEIVRYLRAAGTDINAHDDDGYTALHHASRKSTAALVQTLLECDAEVDARDNKGWTPLHRVVTNGLIPTRLRAGHTQALHTVMYWPEYPCHERSETIASIQRDENVTRLLLNAGADATARRKDGWPVLHLAVLYSTPGVVRALLEVGGLNHEVSHAFGSTPSGVIFHFGRTASLIKKHKLNLFDFPWLVQALVDAALGQGDITKSVTHAKLEFQFAAHADADILRILHEAGDKMQVA